MNDDLLTPKELAGELGVTEKQLNQWRYRGMGPVFIKHGRFIRYRRADITSWLNDCRHSRTDQPVGRAS